jgi:hypothetical protein
MAFPLEFPRYNDDTGARALKGQDCCPEPANGALGLIGAAIDAI